MNCKKCSKPIPVGGVFCPFCGTRQTPTPTRKKRGNGQGSVYKVGEKWRAVVTIGYKLDGKRITLSRQFAKKSDAINALPLLKAEFNPSPVNAGITFRDCFEQMMTQHEKRIGRATAENYRFAFKHFGSIDFLPVRELKTAQLQACVDRVDGKSLKQKMKASASLTFKFACQNDVAEKNYAEYIVIERSEETEREPFTRQEIEQIVAAIGTVPYADYIALLIFTGMRPNELFSLKKSDFHGTYFIGGSKTAAGKKRVIPVPNALLPVVKMDSPGEWAFPAPDGGKMDANNFRKRLYYPALKRAGTRLLPPYSCRHTFATLLKDVDAPATDKQRLMGHSSFSMTAHYTHASTGSLEKIVNSIAVPLHSDPEKTQ